MADQTSVWSDQNDEKTIKQQTTFPLHENEGKSSSFSSENGSAFKRINQPSNQSAASSLIAQAIEHLETVVQYQKCLTQRPAIPAAMVSSPGTMTSLMSNGVGSVTGTPIIWSPLPTATTQSVTPAGIGFNSPMHMLPSTAVASLASLPPAASLLSPIMTNNAPPSTASITPTSDNKPDVTTLSGSPESASSLFENLYSIEETPIPPPEPSKPEPEPEPSPLPSTSEPDEWPMSNVNELAATIDDPLASTANNNDDNLPDSNGQQPESPLINVEHSNEEQTSHSLAGLEPSVIGDSSFDDDEPEPEPEANVMNPAMNLPSPPLTRSRHYSSQKQQQQQQQQSQATDFDLPPPPPPPSISVNSASSHSKRRFDTSSICNLPDLFSAPDSENSVDRDELPCPPKKMMSSGQQSSSSGPMIQTNSQIFSITLPDNGTLEFKVENPGAMLPQTVQIIENNNRRDLGSSQLLEDVVIFNSDLEALLDPSPPKAIIHSSEIVEPLACCRENYRSDVQPLECICRKLSHKVSANCKIEPFATYYEAPGKVILCEACYQQFPPILLNWCRRRKIPLAKADFRPCINSTSDEEETINCQACRRRFHLLCAMWVKNCSLGPFECPQCLFNNGQHYQSLSVDEVIPQCELGADLEKNIGNLVERMGISPSKFAIRVVYSGIVNYRVRVCMKSLYGDSIPPKLSCVSKTIFGFEEVDGHWVIVFAMFVQHYDGPDFNERRINISRMAVPSYLDVNDPSTNYLLIFRCILLSYLEYVANLGYSFVHTWARPVNENDPVFYEAPRAGHEPYPTGNVFSPEWFQETFDYGKHLHLIPEVCSLASTFQHVHLLPYFYDDYWPGEIEKTIRRLQFKEASVKKSKSVANGQASSTAGTLAAMVDMEILSKLHTGQKEFLVASIRARHPDFQLVATQAIRDDPDPATCFFEFLKTPQLFSTRCREFRLGFETFRRARYSTQVLLQWISDIQKSS